MIVCGNLSLPGIQPNDLDVYIKFDFLYPSSVRAARSSQPPPAAQVVDSGGCCNHLLFFCFPSARSSRRDTKPPSSRTATPPVRRRLVFKAAHGCVSVELQVWTVCVCLLHGPPEYNQSFTLAVNRNHRGFRRVVTSRGIKLELLHKGWAQSNTHGGTSASRPHVSGKDFTWIHMQKPTAAVWFVYFIYLFISNKLIKTRIMKNKITNQNSKNQNKNK